MITNSVLEAISKFSLLEADTIVTVALSGGADSMALLNVLITLKDRLNIKVKAAHLNHLIRGDEAYRDEEFVKKQCEILNVPLVCQQKDVPKYAKENNLSLELAARKLRYEFLNEISEGVIATAHTASDNLETVIFNLTRGTGIDGLCGIPAKRDNIIRPLILCTRDMIEGYCQENNIPFVTDSTNLSDDYTRNRIRHSVIPILKSINPSVEKTALRSSVVLKEISDDLIFSAKNFIEENLTDNKLLVSDINSIPASTFKKIIIEFVKIFDNSILLENCHIEEIFNICKNGGKTSIPKNCYCRCQNHILEIFNSNADIEENDQYNLEITEISKEFYEKNINVNNLLLNNSFDCDKIVGKLVVRTRLPGDSIRLNNHAYTKPLTKLYNELKIPRGKRSSLPVIADDRGVVWIHDIGIASRCAVSKKTERIYYVECEINQNR